MVLHPAFLRGLLLRSIVIWVGVRGLLLVTGLLLRGLSGFADPLVPALPAALVIVALVGGLTVLDGRRQGETVLLANLGVPEWHLLLLAMVPPSVCEAIIQVVA